MTGTGALSCRATWLLAKAGFPHLKVRRDAMVAISSQSGASASADQSAQLRKSCTDHAMQADGS